MNPVRLYLVVSLFYFFVFQLASSRLIEEQTSSMKAQSDVSLDGITGLGDSTLIKLDEVLDPDLIEDINDKLEEKTIAGFLKQLDDSTKYKVLQALDSVELVAFQKEGLSLDNLDLNPISSLTINFGDKTDTITIQGDSLVSNGNSTVEKSISNWNIIEKYKDDKGMSDQMLFDSLSTESNSGFKNYLWKQYIRVRRSDEQLISNYIVDNLPLMMLFLLPVFALILKLLYVRRKILYIKHLIHALHLHSFAYLTYGVAILLMIYFSKGGSTDNWITFITFIIVSTYAYISFLRVYKQGKIKTFLKFNMVGFIYGYCLFFFFLAELFISFLLY